LYKEVETAAENTIKTGESHKIRENKEVKRHGFFRPRIKNCLKTVHFMVDHGYTGAGLWLGS